MSRSEKQRDQIFKIESYEKFDVEITKKIKRFCRKVYAIYSTLIYNS